MNPREKTPKDQTPISPPDGDDLRREAIIRCASLDPTQKFSMGNTTPSHGGEGGQPFDDGWQNGRIESISIQHGFVINAITVNYGHGVKRSHGEGGGVVHSAVVLQKGEYLTAIDVWYGRAVHCLTFHSNLQTKFGPFGLPKEKNVTVQAPPGYMLVGFLCHAGTHIETIGFRFRPIHAEGRWSTKGTADDIVDVALQDAPVGENMIFEDNNICTATYYHEHISKLVDSGRDVLSSLFTLRAQLDIEYSPLSSVVQAYERALVNLLQNAERCLRVPASHDQRIEDLDYQGCFLDCMIPTLNEMNTSLQRINSWKCSYFCLVPNVQNSLMKELKSTLAKLDVIVLELMQIEMYIFGSAVHIKHPVLQLAWALCDVLQRHGSCLKRDLFVKNLLTLLRHEIGDSALKFMESFWRDCVTSFVSKLGCPDCEVLFVAGLIRWRNPGPLGSDFMMPTGNYSVRQMLVESEFYHGSEVLSWKGDSMDEPLIIKWRTLTSVQESKRVCTFIIPQLELFLGVDVWATVEVFDTKHDGLAVVQYQVCDCPPKDAFGCYESTSVKFTIGSGAAQPGDQIKILIAGSWIEKDSPIHLQVLRASAIFLTSKTQGNADSKLENLAVGDIEEHPSIEIKHCVCQAPIVDWGIIDTLDGLKASIYPEEEWRVHCYVHALSSMRKSIQHFTDAVEMDWPSSWLTNNLCDFLELLSIRLKLFNESFQQSANRLRLVNEITSQFDEIGGIVPRLNILIGSIFGSAIRIQHPVLRQVWMLAGYNQRSASGMKREIFAENLRAILEQEIGNDASTDYEPWKEKIQSLLCALGRSGSEGIFVGDLNSACPSPLPPDCSARKMLEKSATIGWGISLLVDRRVIIQQGVRHKSASNLLLRVVSKVGELQSLLLCLEQEMPLNLSSDYSVLALWLRTCRRLSVAVDLLPETILDDVCNSFILAMLVLEASCKSTKLIRAAVFLRCHFIQILKDQCSQLREIIHQLLPTERCIFGTAEQLSDPVLQRVWVLVGADQLNMRSIPRNLGKEILLALLQHEIGDGAFESCKAIWKACAISFLSKLGDRQDDKVSAFDLKRVGNVQLPGDHSLRRMLVESECLYNTAAFCWRGYVGGKSLFVKRTIIPLVPDLQTHKPAGSVDESFCAKFMIPQLEVFLGVDVRVDVEVKDAKVVGLVTIQYQVGDGCSQLGCLVWCKSSTCEFTIGSAAAKPGDCIKIWMTWPKISGLLVTVGRVEACAICIVDCKPESGGSEEIGTGVLGQATISY